MRRRLSALLTVLGLAVAACGGGGSAAPTTSATNQPASAAADPCAASTTSGAVTASIVDFDFDPATVQASVGDVVTWTNDGDAPHTATLDDHPDCATPELANGESGGIQFNAAGTYAFHCALHPDMTGTVEVSG
jgi:plastocyanin